MEATVTNPSIVFSESHKAVDQTQIDVFNNPTNRIEISLYDLQSFTDGSTPDDKTVINFSVVASNGIDFNDAVKFTNLDENLGRLEGSSLLSIENRAASQNDEVLELYTNNYRTTDYMFVVEVNGLLDNTVSLYDHYTNTETVLNNDASTAVSFTVDPSNPASEATDRFELRFETSTLSTNEFDLQGISVYPNPASDILNVNHGENTGRFENLEIYDITGRLVAAQELDNQLMDVKINVDALSSEVYILKVNSSSKQFSIKVIIEK